MIDEALAESPDLVDWRRKQAETQYTNLAPRCRNKVLHLVGGLADEWEAGLVENLELAQLQRHESEKGKSPTADWVGSTHRDEDIVVILWERIGHPLSNKVKDACKKRGVTCVEARSGERAFLEALERELRG